MNGEQGSRSWPASSASENTASGTSMGMGAPPPFPPQYPCAPPPAPKPIIKRGALFWIISVFAGLFLISTVVLSMVCLGLLVVVGGGAAEDGLVKQVISGSGEGEILQLSVAGVINGGDGGFGGSSDTVGWVRRQLVRARADHRVKAILLEIDSPGGGVAASDNIYRDLVEHRRMSNQPIVAHLGDTAASGGYYIACAADMIVADRSALTGSIGVILPLFGVNQLLDKIGVESRTITSAPHKEIGAFYKPMSSDDRAILENIATQLHGQFVRVVTEGFERRRLPDAAARAKELATGMVFTGEQARENGLVDAVGYRDDAKIRAMSLAGLTEARLVAYRRRPGLLEAALAGAEGASVPRRSRAAMAPLDSPRFMYLWTAGQDVLVSSAEALKSAL